ncbi:MAG: ComF family protein [Candidatus Levybacteria bacterium]|nr:ComF family protein [Candidatus Levybacteria bacterium]
MVGLLDFFFPKYCVSCKALGSYLCPSCFAKLSYDIPYTCFVCQRPSLDGQTHPGCQGRYTIDGSFSGIAYKGIAKKLIYVFKYKPYVSDLQTALVELLYESLIQNEAFIKLLDQQFALVPIPLHATRFRQRGYNQSEVLAHGLSKKFGIPVIAALLRTKATKPQAKLKKKERIANISGAFALSPSFAISLPAGRQANIMFVDDIATTGATMLEAANVLKRAGAKKVWGITLAKD